MSNDGIVCPTCLATRKVALRGQAYTGRYEDCPTCGGAGRLYTRADLDAAVKAALTPTDGGVILTREEAVMLYRERACDWDIDGCLEVVQSVCAKLRAAYNEADHDTHID